MATRLFDNNHEWTDKAHELDRHVKSALQTWVTANPGIDPRDIQLVATESIGDMIRWVIVRARRKKAKPKCFDPDDDDDE